MVSFQYLNLWSDTRHILMQKHYRHISLNHKLVLWYRRASLPHWEPVESFSLLHLYFSAWESCAEFTLIRLCCIMKFQIFTMLLLITIKGTGNVGKPNPCTVLTNVFEMKWSFFFLFPEVKAGQKSGVSYESYAKQSVVCQDTLRVLGHWLCPRVIYHPSQWANSCLVWPFHRALQSLCIHSTSPSPVPALPHPVCFLIST